MGHETVEQDREDAVPTRSPPTAAPARRRPVVGSANDPAEAEADRVAAEVMGRLAASGKDGDGGPAGTDRATRIRRAATPIGAAGGPVDEELHRQIEDERSSGTAMDPALRQQMEGAFGADFSGVRMHVNARSDRLNGKIQASAFTLGPDIHVRRDRYAPNSADGRRLIAHELAHTIQQGSSSVDQRARVQPMAPGRDVGRVRRDVIRRDGGSRGQPSYTVVRRADHGKLLDDMVPRARLGNVFDKRTSQLTNKLSKAFGVKGMSFFRSEAAKGWRKGLKDQAREQGRDDVRSAVLANTTIQYDTERAYYEIQAKKRIYSAAKGSIQTVLSDSVRELVTAAWEGHKQDVIGDAARQARDAAWAVLRDDPTSPKLIKNAQGVAEAKALEVLADSYHQAEREAHGVKRKVVNRENTATTPPSSMHDLGGAVAQQVTKDDLGGKALTQTIEADSVESGIGVFGKLLDQAVGASGDQIDLSVEIQVPINEGPGYVSFTLSGRAARGIDGATTAGVPKFGDPRRLEVKADLAFKVGADLIGLDLNAGVNFFVRAGGNDTALCMKSLSYGAYRAIGATSHKAANWWAGTTKDVEEGRAQRAEAWAAMLEEQAFKNGEGFVDVGAGLTGSAKLTVGGHFASGELTGDIAGFQRYDKKALEKSLGGVDYTDERGRRHTGENMFAKPVTSKEAAEARRKHVSSRRGGAWGASLTVEAGIAGQKVIFAGSISVPIGAPGWGIEVSGSLEYGGTSGGVTPLDRWGAGCATAIADLVKRLIETRKAKTGAALDGATGATQIVNAGLDNAITDGLGEAWKVEGSKASMDFGSTGVPDKVAGLATSSTLQVALILGHDGESIIARLEIRSGRKLEVNTVLAGAGVKVSAEKTSRLFAVGYDQGGWDAEALGIRARGRKDQVDKGGRRRKHRT